MGRLRKFFMTTLLGGIIVVLPAALMIFLVQWVLGLIGGAIRPISRQLRVEGGVHETLATLAALAIVLGACFVVGLIVRTRAGKWAIAAVENATFKRLWGYSLIKESVTYLFGAEKSPFSTVALVRIYDSETLASAFVTDTHPDGSYTVFVPTGPNPTSGNIFHVPGSCVHIVGVPVEEAMRSIISCGAGSTKLIEAYRRRLESGDKPQG